QLVLHYFEKVNGLFVFKVIIYTRGIDVFYLFVEKFLRKTYLPNALLQFVEIIHLSARLKAIIIQCNILDDVFFQTLCSPNTELCTLNGFHPIANRNNDI